MHHLVTRVCGRREQASEIDDKVCLAWDASLQGWRAVMQESIERLITRCGWLGRSHIDALGCRYRTLRSEIDDTLCLAWYVSILRTAVSAKGAEQSDLDKVLLLCMLFSSTSTPDLESAVQCMV